MKKAIHHKSEIELPAPFRNVLISKNGPLLSTCFFHQIHDFLNRRQGYALAAQGSSIQSGERKKAAGQKSSGQDFLSTALAG